MSSADDWVATKDPSSGRTYYYNKKTRETSWTKPSVLSSSDASSGSGGSGGSGVSSSSSSSSSDWSEAKDPKSGKSYYYNKKTKETTWTKPAGFDSPSSSSSSSNNSSSSNSSSATTSATTTTAAVTSATAKSPSSTSAATGGTVAKPEKRQRTGKVSPDGKWEEILEPTSNKTYWYNKQTKATAWNLPSSANVTAGTTQQSYSALARNDSDLGEELVATDIATSNPTSPVSAVKEVKQDTATTSAATEGREIERPSDRMLKLKQALHQREQEETKADDDDDDDDDDGEAYEFRFAKHRHGWLNRTFRIGKVYDEEKLLTFKKSLIKKALLKKNRDLDAECIQCFKNIMSYMGDRKSSKAPMGHARKLLANAMKQPAGLRDEIYLQLCKQTTNNPSAESTLKGWELMIMCLATFPPSKPIKKFLTSYFKTTRDADQTFEDIRAFAEDALTRLDKIAKFGQRKEVPSAEELECVQKRQTVPIRVYMVNNTFKTIPVDSYTKVSNLQEIVVNKLDLTVAAGLFAMYESDAVDTNADRILEPKDRVLDVMASWDPYSGEADVEELKGVARSLDKTKTEKSGADPTVPTFSRFRFKAKLVLKTSVPQVIQDSEAVNLLYAQAVHDVVTARYPVKEKDVEVLGALQLQATFGDYQADAHGPGWLVDKIDQYVPSFFITRKGKVDPARVSDWEQRILSKYSKITGFTAIEAKLNYLDYAQEWPFYGATFFSVEQRQFKDYPSPLLVGITCEGVVLMHPQKNTMLENYPYTDIVTWGHSDERFIVVVGNIVQQRKLIFKTRLGKVINNLIHDYVKFKVESK